MSRRSDRCRLSTIGGGLGAILLLLLASDSLSAQTFELADSLRQSDTRPNAERPYSIGIAVGPTMAVTESDRTALSFGGEGSFQYRLSATLALAGTVHYLHYRDRHSVPNFFDVAGTTIGGDLRIRYRFSDLPLRPTFHAGFGGMRYIVDSGATDASPFNEQGDYDGAFVSVPVGVDIIVPLPFDHIDLALSGTLHFGLTDGINPNLDGQIDNIATFTIGPRFGVGLSDAERIGDRDGDGLLDIDEVNRYGTDPDRADSDGDGLDDGMELRLVMTDPLDPDTDKDSLSDGLEVRVYRIDPLDPDSDGDRLTDGEEVHIHLSRPHKVDTDGDGLSDGDEVLIHGTSPVNVDTDGDRAADGAELGRWKSDPNVPDTDRDGLLDGAEIMEFGTNPTLFDTDGGGVGDGDEIEAGTDPLEPLDDR